MKSLLLHIFTLLLSINVGISQNGYSPSQLQSFVDIYMDAKSDRSISGYELQLSSKLDAYDISYVRYREIIHTRDTGMKIQLTPNEKSFIKEIQTADEKIKKNQNGALSKLCTEKSLDFSTYIEIRELYKTDIKFQRSLKPYFDHYLNAEK